MLENPMNRTLHAVPAGLERKIFWAEKLLEKSQAESATAHLIILRRKEVIIQLGLCQGFLKGTQVSVEFLSGRGSGNGQHSQFQIVTSPYSTSVSARSHCIKLTCTQFDIHRPDTQNSMSPSHFWMTRLDIFPLDKGISQAPRYKSLPPLPFNQAQNSPAGSPQSSSLVVSQTSCCAALRLVEPASLRQMIERRTSGC